MKAKRKKEKTEGGREENKKGSRVRDRASHYIPGHTKPSHLGCCSSGPLPPSPLPHSLVPSSHSLRHSWSRWVGSALSASSPPLQRIG